MLKFSNNAEDDSGGSTSDNDAVKENSSAVWYLTINWCAKAIHDHKLLLYKLGCCIHTFNSLSCQIIACKHDIKASFYNHGGLISCDPPSFPVIFFLPFEELNKLWPSPVFHPPFPLLISDKSISSQQLTYVINIIWRGYNGKYETPKRSIAVGNFDK